MATPLATPLAGSVADWRIITAASRVQFRARRYVFGTVQGTFRQVRGVVRSDEADPRYTHVDVRIPVASLTTGHWLRDAHILGTDLLDGTNYQTIRFVGHWLRGDPQREFSLDGDLTLRDVSREVILRVQAGNRDIDAAAGIETARFRATVVVDRRDFGLVTRGPFRWSGLILGYQLHVVVDVTMGRVLRPSSSGNRLTAKRPYDMVHV